MAQANSAQWILIAATKDGSFIAHYSERGLCALEFPSEHGGASKPRRAADAPPHVVQWHRITEASIESILQGELPKRLPPLDLSRGTEFQQDVWKLLREIRPGHTRSYGEIAQMLGRPKATRAVGQACGANPVPLLVPCHRILAANQRIGGFSGGFGWKEKLLAREGHVFQQGKRIETKAN